ncbi:hypothetical protein OFN46_06370 [Escherichia coli]|nr:hypothetical protein [Escherichia coli]
MSTFVHVGDLVTFNLLDGFQLVEVKTGEKNNELYEAAETTRKRTAKFVSLYGVVKFNSTVRFRLWQPAKWRGGKYGGVIPSPLRTPSCQVDHTLK